MSDLALERVVELALKLTVTEQAKLLERIAAHLALEIATEETDGRVLDGRTYEIWSPQDEGGAVSALNQALQEHQQLS